jgi:hypothetical protein
MRVRVRPNFLDFAKNGYEHPGLRANAEYYVLEVTNEYYRVVNHRGEPILYPKELFEVADHAVPSGWHFRDFDDGEYFLDPASIGRPGFYELWFGSDGDIPGQQAARQLFRDELVRLAKLSGEDDKKLIDEALARLPAE